MMHLVLFVVERSRQSLSQVAFGGQAGYTDVTALELIAQIAELLAVKFV